MTVQPLGPVEGDAAARPNLGNGSRGRAVDKVAGNVRALKVVDRGNAAAAKGDSGWGWYSERVDANIPSGVAADISWVRETNEGAITYTVLSAVTR